MDTVIDIEEDDVSGSQGIEFPRPNFFGGHSNVTHSFRLVRDRLLDFADALSYLQSISQWLSEICLWASHDPELAHNVIYTNPEMFDGPRVLLEGIIHREKGFAGNFIAAGSTVQDGPSILKTFFKEFAEYLKVIFRANQALLLGEVSPELAAASSSPKLYDFLTIVFRTLAKTAPLFETCERRYSIKQDALLEQFADVLVCAQLEGLLDWDQFLDLAQDKGPQQDKVTTYLRIISSMQLSFLRIYSFAESMREADPDAISGKLAGLLQQSRVVYTYLDKHFRQSLSQKMSRVGTANDNLLFINEIERLHQAMCRIDDSVASEFLQRRGLDAGALDDVEARIASDAVLKLDLLRHMIMVGKMDFRVIGIDASAGLLASLYRDRLEIFPVAAEDPILQIIAQFLDKLKLISYLVGSQSHPELTKHSTNIVAFLMVTGRFTPLISDEIWGDMTSTSNPRTRDAIIQLLDDMHGNYQWKDIQHRCLQICQLPPEQMDMRIIRHAFRTLETAIQKARHSTSSYRTTRGMLDLCIKLLRHATAYEASSQLGMDEATWHAARDKLHACLQCNSAPEDLQAVLRECVEDVKSRTITATGSMQAMIIVIQHLRLTQVEIEPVKWLAEHHDLVHLFAAELQGAVKVERSKIGRVAINDMVMSVRLHLLQEIIFEAPASIEGDDERLIMSYFFGEQALADRYRQMFWLQMARFTDTLVTGNQVVDRLRDHYCQHLPGQFIFMEVIEFVAQTIHLDSQLEKHGAIAEDHIIDIPSSDLLWRMIFQAPDDRIAHRAAYILLRSYEDARINRNAPASALTVTYTMIIERCMRNLIDSAQAVPRMYDQNDAKTSEARQVKNVVQFRRALALLQILLSNYRAKEPVKASASGGNSSPELYGGDPLVIRWQASTMKSTSEIESFTINDESPASGLKKRLQIATGFQRFDVFFQGKKFEPDLGLLTDLIKDTPFVSGHLLLVRKTYAPGELEDSGSKLLTKMDLEVLKHFDTLYELFSLPLIYSQHVSLCPDIQQIHTTNPALGLRLRAAIPDPRTGDQPGVVLRCDTL